ncbi:MAG: IclR family transcriptional regulator [Anaerolineae bacterium]
MLKTIERTSQMLNLFSPETPEWGITELAETLGWNTSTTHDLASSLSQIGFLRKSDKRRYKIGWRVLEMSQVVLSSSNLQVEARKVMEQFTTKYDETILLGVLAGGKILFAERIVAKHFLDNNFPTPEGRYSAHCTAAGKVLIAHLSAENLQNLIDEHGLDPMTPKSIQSIEQLHDDLERIRVQGHAYQFEESVLGLGSVAAPIYDYSGKVVASLTITAPIQQFERQIDDYRSAILRMTKQVSKRLGHMV